jgi:hypothetical protein
LNFLKKNRNSSYKMTSVERSPAQVPANKLYINVTGIQSTIYDGTVDEQGALVRAPWVVEYGALSTAGAAVLRDMGKYIYLPAPGGASQSTILRKVQLVPSGTFGYYGVGGEAGTSTEYFTGYISLGGQSFGGGNGTATGVARLN